MEQEKNIKKFATVHFRDGGKLEIKATDGPIRFGKDTVTIPHDGGETVVFICNVNAVYQLTVE